MLIQDVRKLAHKQVSVIASKLLSEQKSYKIDDFKLDESQTKLINSNRRFIRVIAPAGAGKTKSLVAKAAKIISDNPSARILTFTFTNAAAQEFKQRAIEMGLSQECGLHVCTINSFGYELIKKFVPNCQLVTPQSDWALILRCIIDLLKSRPILRQDEQNSYLNQIAELTDLTKTLGFYHNSSIQETQSHYNALCTLKRDTILHLKMSEANLGSDNLFSTHKNEFMDIFFQKWFPFWQELTTQLWNSKIITLEDQKYWALHLLAYDQKAQTWLLQQKISHVLVDEFQDINYLELFFVAQVVHMSNANLIIVGDDDQCIYEWRGCTPHFIQDPDKYLAFFCNDEKFETVFLKRNYRCPRNVVEHSSKLINKNQFRISKHIEAVQTQNANIRVISLPSAYYTIHIVHELVAQLSTLHPQHSIAILGRKKCQLVPIQILFTKHGTRFKISNDLNVFLTPTISNFKKVLTVLLDRNTPIGEARSIHNLFVLLNNLYRLPISLSERKSIIKFLKPHNPQTLEQAINLFATYPGPLKRGNADPEDSAFKLKFFLESKTVKAALIAIRDHFKGFEKDFRKAKDDIFYSDPPFGHLIDLAIDYESDFAAFILDIEKSLQEANGSISNNTNVELMTAFRAKGREFDTVIILDANNTIWPSSQAEESGFLEEERRLFYVSVSRTRNNLLIFDSGMVQGKLLSPSRFIKELELPDSAWMKNNDLKKLSNQLFQNLLISS
ncbi:MAG: ATP-dependent helicase [Methylacidiphilales bacterium]|nr:ATP-dependent helicase [Candidatus Methylacidiphilales bacterium]MDW8350207.1 ATP-dependent helicase [Verrucomicrobiae bacterium]